MTKETNLGANLRQMCIERKVARTQTAPTQKAGFVFQSQFCS